MALKKDKQKELAFLELMATRLLQSNSEGGLESAMEAIKEDVVSFQEDTKTVLTPSLVDGDVKFSVIDLNKDFLRVRSPNDEATNLRTRKYGVGIDIKVVKSGDFDHANEHMVRALRALADDLESLPFEINTLKNEDLTSERIKELSPTLDEDESSEGHDVGQEQEDDLVESTDYDSEE